MNGTRDKSIFSYFRLPKSKQLEIYHLCCRSLLQRIDRKADFTALCPDQLHAYYGAKKLPFLKKFPRIITMIIVIMNKIFVPLCIPSPKLKRRCEHSLHEDEKQLCVYTTVRV